MTVPSPLPSNRLIFDIARSTREEMRTHFEAADTKAGIILAFNGILIPLAKDIEGPSRTIGVALSGISAIVAFAAYWPKNFPIPDTVELRNYLTWPEYQAYVEIGDTFLDIGEDRQAGDQEEDAPAKNRAWPTARGNCNIWSRCHHDSQ